MMGNRAGRAWMWSLAALAMVALVLLGGDPTGGQQRVKLKQAHTSVLFAAPIYIAKEKGYFAEEGLDVELIEVESGQLGATALVAGEVQIFDADPLMAVQLREQGKRMIFFYNLNNRMTMDFIMRNEVAKAKGISRQDPLDKRLAALKGLKLGITRPGAATDFNLRYYLKRAKLDPDRDVSIIAIGGGGPLTAALKTGQIDAFMLSPPTPALAEKEGLGTIIIKSSAGDVPEFANFLYAALAVMEDFATKNGDVLQRYCRAMNKANRYLRTELDGALAALQKEFSKTKPDILRLAMTELLPSLSADGKITEAAFNNHLTFLLDQGFIKSKQAAAEGVLWTNKYNR